MPYPDQVARAQTAPETALDPVQNPIGGVGNAHTFRGTADSQGARDAGGRPLDPYAGISSPPLESLGSAMGIAGRGSPDDDTPRTFGLKQTAEQQFTEVRLWLYQNDEVRLSRFKGVVAATEDIGWQGIASDDVGTQPISGAAVDNGLWVPITWGGADTVEFSTQATQQTPYAVVSDWIPVTSIAPAGAHLPLTMARVYIEGIGGGDSGPNELNFYGKTAGSDRRRTAFGAVHL